MKTTTYNIPEAVPKYTYSPDGRSETRLELLTNTNPNPDALSAVSMPEAAPHDPLPLLSDPERDASEAGLALHGFVTLTSPCVFPSLHSTQATVVSFRLSI